MDANLDRLKFFEWLSKFVDISEFYGGVEDCSFVTLTFWTIETGEGVCYKIYDESYVRFLLLGSNSNGLTRVT